MRRLCHLPLTAALLAAVPALAAPSPPAPVIESADLAAQFDQIVNFAVADGFAGRVVVADRSSVIYDRLAGYSDVAGKVPVRADTLFHVASITKYLTAILILKAAEEGRLDLDQNIGLFLADTGLAERDVSVRQLLSHHSGMGSSYAAENEQTAEAAIAAIEKQPIDPEKVGKFRYSNDGYDLLGIILEQAYGQSYEDILREKIAGPAGLSQTFAWSEADKTDPKVVSQPLSEINEKLYRRNYGMLGSAGLLTTAIDLVELQRALVREQIVNSDSLSELWQPRDRISIGQTTFGGFLRESEKMGPVFNVRGNEDWGDNAIMNHYLDHGLFVAVVTSKGPAEDSGKKPFRDSISQAIEFVLPRLP
jgi:CubicO group peptidase (beta-lactamase class C family)